MADRRRDARRDQTPERVQQAARAMNVSAPYGIQRGYVPQNTGGYQPGAYPGIQQNPRAVPPGSGRNMGGVPPYTPAMGGGQRGFIMPDNTGGARGKNGGKKAKKAFLTALAAIVLLAGLSVGIYILVDNSQKKSAYEERKRQQEAEIRKMEQALMPYREQYLPGIRVDGIELGGMTQEMARNSVRSQIQQRNDTWSVTLTYQGRSYETINAGTLNITLDEGNVESILYEAWQPGHSGTLQEAYETMNSLKMQPMDFYTLQSDGDRTAIDSVLAGIKERIDRPAEDARMERFDPSLDNPFVFTDEVYGLNLDTEPLRTELYHMASSMRSGTLEITPEQIMPAVRRVDVVRHYMLLSTATTSIDPHSSDNRNDNIRLAFSKISGYVLQPGKTFSFNKIVGERSASNGFLTAIEYVYGEHVEGIGGGVCQASTTVYQAAVCAGLKVKGSGTKRYYHSDEVSYAKRGTDATVSDTKGHEKDLKFINNTDYPIYFVAEVLPDPSNKRRLICRVRLYGEDQGDVRYELDSDLVETLPAPFEPEYVKDKKGEYVTYTDQQKTVSEAKEGYIYKSYRLRYESNILTGREELYTDRYEPKAEKIYVGVKTREY